MKNNTLIWILLGAAGLWLLRRKKTVTPETCIPSYTPSTYPVPPVHPVCPAYPAYSPSVPYSPQTVVGDVGLAAITAETGVGPWSVPLWLGLSSEAPKVTGSIGNWIADTFFGGHQTESGGYKRPATAKEKERVYWAKMLPSGMSIKGMSNQQIKDLVQELIRKGVI